MVGLPMVGLPVGSSAETAECMGCATGKAKAAGPEVKRGRGDLAEVLWQSSNPYKDGRSLGDQWLDAKGKQRVEGPEMRRGRRVCSLRHMYTAPCMPFSACKGCGRMADTGNCLVVVGCAAVQYAASHQLVQPSCSLFSLCITAGSQGTAKPLFQPVGQHHAAGNTAEQAERTDASANQPSCVLKVLQLAKQRPCLLNGNSQNV